MITATLVREGYGWTHTQVHICASTRICTDIPTCRNGVPAGSGGVAEQRHADCSCRPDQELQEESGSARSYQDTQEDVVSRSHLDHFAARELQRDVGKIAVNNHNLVVGFLQLVCDPDLENRGQRRQTGGSKIRRRECLPQG